MRTTIDRHWKIRHYKAIDTPPKTYFAPLGAQIALAEGLHARAVSVARIWLSGYGPSVR